MNVENLTIMGDGVHNAPRTHPGSFECTGRTLNGIWFNGAGGSVTNVTVTGINGATAIVKLDRAIVANGTAGQTVTITDTTVSGYNKNGIQATGMTMNVSGSTIGAPAALQGLTGQNGLVYIDGATGTTSGSTIYGSGYGGASERKHGCAPVRGDKRHLDGRHHHGRRNRHRRGRGQPTSTGVIVDRNQIGRTAPDVPDTFGFGVEVDPGSTATVTCNTFSGWKSDFNPAGAVTSQAGLCHHHHPARRHRRGVPTRPS